MARLTIRSTQYMLFGLFVFATPASAASFDCSAATTAREKLICSDKILSELDEQLGRINREKTALLSVHGAELLQRSEQSWLNFIGVICPLDAKPINHW